MRKVLAINASPRRQKTAGMIDALRSYLQTESLELQSINLKDYEIRSCIGCHRCINGHNCHLVDQVNELKGLMIEADAIVIASPVYMTGIPGTLKTLIDRTAEWFHRPVLIGKPLLILVSTAGSYASSTAREIAKIGMHWGCAITGSWTRTAWQKVDAEGVARTKAARKFTSLLRSDSRSYRPSWRHVYLFNLQKVLARNILEVDRVFWNQHNWFNRGFFFECRTGIVKSLTYRMLYWILVRVIVQREPED